MKVRAAVAAVALVVGSALTVGPAGAQTPGAGSPSASGRLTPILTSVADAATSAPQLRVAPVSPAGVPDNTPGGLRRLADGQIVVDVLVTDASASGQGALKAAGATVLAVESPATAITDPSNRAGRLFTVTVSIRDAQLRMLAAAPNVRNVHEVLAGTTGVGAVTSEGDTALRAGQARGLGVDGTGQTVGVLSDSYDRNPAGAATNATQDVASCDLPGAGNTCGRTTAVNVIDDTAGGNDEGRAMLQTVHDIAPGANLAFATAATSETAFANNITALRNAGATVIVDDYAFFAEPFYQDGPIAVAINQARAAGVAYFTMAFNNNLVVGGRDVSSYEAPTYRGVTCPTLPITYLDCHDFDTAGTDNTYGMTVAANMTLSLSFEWAQPRGGVTANYDIYVLDAGTGTVLAQRTEDDTVSQQPVEVINWANPSATTARNVNVVIARRAGPAVRMKFIHLQNGAQGITAVEYNQSAGGDVIGPAIFGHNGAQQAFTVGAVPQNNLSIPEPYTSHGPVTVLFQPVPSTAALGAPVVANKPDFSAVDCVVNTFFPVGSGAPHRFCGTSDAAPHAAAVGALLRQARPAATPTDVGASLVATAIPVGTATADVVGAGLIQADAAVLNIVGITSAVPPPPPACTTTVTGFLTGPLSAGAGVVLCLSAARVTGPVTVGAGGAVLSTDSRVTGSIVANGAAYVRLCNTDVTNAAGNPAVSATGSTGPVVVGDPANGCARSRTLGDITLTSNTKGVYVGGNQVAGGGVAVTNNTGGVTRIYANTITPRALSCTGNSLPPSNGGLPNSAAGGKTGQCAAI